MSSVTAPPEMAEAHLSKGYILRAMTAGTSMWPTLRPGTEVEIEPCGRDEVRIGDVALVRTRVGLVLHRIVGLTDVHVILRGDALLHRDQPVKRDCVLGRMASRRRDRFLGCYGRLAAPFFNIGIRIHGLFFDR